MLLEDAVKYVSDRFEYLSDGKVLGDSWRVMPLTNNTFMGDCDDYAITCFWYLSDKNIFKFLLHLLITHRYALYRCKTHKGQWHIVGRFNDLWFDNWSFAPMSEDDFFNKTKHVIYLRYSSRIIAWFLIIGLFKK